MKKYDLVPTSTFKKGYNRMRKRGFDMTLLDAVLEKLSSGEKLDPRFRDHALSGNRKDNRECHIANDWLLEYRIVEKDLILIAISTGTHQDLFGS